MSSSSSHHPGIAFTITSHGPPVSPTTAADVIASSIMPPPIFRSHHPLFIMGLLNRQTGQQHPHDDGHHAINVVENGHTHLEETVIKPLPSPHQPPADVDDYGTNIILTNLGSPTPLPREAWSHLTRYRLEQQDEPCRRWTMICWTPEKSGHRSYTASPCTQN